MDPVPQKGADDARLGALGSKPGARVIAQAAPRPSGAHPGAQTFVQGKGDATTININDIQQTTAATCTIGAGMGALAYTERGRRALTRMIHDNGDGTLTVTLWNKPMKISVDRIKSMPMAYGDFNGKPGDPRWETWPKAMEAAYARGAKWLFNIEFHRNPIGEEGAPIELALRAVTQNQPVTTKTMEQLDRTQTIPTLARELNRGKVILAASKNDERLTMYGLVPRHAYAVLGVNEKTNNVFLFDPHGKTQSVPLDDFRALFSHVAWAYLP